jgi:hypothetical protein
MQDVIDGGLGKLTAVSRYPGMGDLCDKGVFTRLVDTSGETFPWWPETYIWPEHATQIEKMCKKHTAILKPEEASQGDGIAVCPTFSDLQLKLSVRNTSSAVVQRYLSKPLLLGALKFDMRIYVVVGPGLDAPTAVCRQGLARFCTEPYAAPTSGNAHKVMGHLTNYSLNKRAAGYTHGDESGDETATKRLLSTALGQIANEYPSFDEASFWEQVDTMASDVVELFLPVLRATWVKSYGASSRCPCFQILGFDVMLDEKLRPWLLEVNNSPSLCIDEVKPAPPGEPKPCLCMDMQGPHVHEPCAVDVECKRIAVAGALARVAGGLEGVGAPDPYYADVEPGVDGTTERLLELWLAAGGAEKAFSSFAIRRLMAPILAGKQVTTVDLDLLSQRFKRPQLQSEARDADLAFITFQRMLQEIANKVFPGEDSLDKLVALL